PGTSFYAGALAPHDVFLLWNKSGVPRMRLEDLTPGTDVRGILPDATVSVVNVQWHGSNALTLIYRDPAGRVADEILYRDDEARLEVVEQGRPWSFDGD